ncbi:hypothetical protein [Acinetobacter populi]|uniref:Uncharacterized protein n=1 Tax=Acinetobacter populi TaxID=1582270 RepID=A0A1Z9YTF6_9GAMM|nr:hypothetical protein [Acinetobacter populi]OUY05505.1 hypothetical protein CAP51_16985 [Acinetobacter populi]
MQYRRSIGVMRQDDWQQVIDMLDNYLLYVQQDINSTNDNINDIKLLIHKLQHNMNLPPRYDYNIRNWQR